MISCSNVLSFLPGCTRAYPTTHIRYSSVVYRETTEQSPEDKAPIARDIAAVHQQPRTSDSGASRAEPSRPFPAKAAKPAAAFTT